MDLPRLPNLDGTWKAAMSKTPKEIAAEMTENINLSSVFKSDAGRTNLRDELYGSSKVRPIRESSYESPYEPHEQVLDNSPYHIPSQYRTQPVAKKKVKSQQQANLKPQRQAKPAQPIKEEKKPLFGETKRVLDL